MAEALPLELHSNNVGSRMSSPPWAARHTACCSSTSGASARGPELLLADPEKNARTLGKVMPFPSFESMCFQKGRDSCSNRLRSGGADFPDPAFWKPRGAVSLGVQPRLPEPTRYRRHVSTRERDPTAAAESVILRISTRRIERNGLARDLPSSRPLTASCFQFTILESRLSSSTGSRSVEE